MGLRLYEHIHTIFQGVVVLTLQDEILIFCTSCNSSASLCFVQSYEPEGIVFVQGKM